MYGNKFHWLHQNVHVTAAQNMFKTLVRFGIVDTITDPGEWVSWYGTLRSFVGKYER